MAIERFKTIVPDFPESQILDEDFFTHHRHYDLLVEQTFFSSLPMNLRKEYAKKVHSLLAEGGKMVGHLFNNYFSFVDPPFGGRSEEYENLFQP